jgi:hypothetical protein
MIAAWALASVAFVTSEGSLAIYVTDRFVRATSVQVAPLWFVFVVTHVGAEEGRDSPTAGGAADLDGPTGESDDPPET